MSLFEPVHAAMADVGRRGTIPAVDEYAAEQMWHIATDAQTQIHAELDEARRVLVLTTRLGAPVQDDPTLAADAMALSHHWDELFGMRLTIDASCGDYWLLTELGAGDLQGALLEETLLRLTAGAEACRDILAARPKSDTAAAERATDMIRI